MTALAAPFSDCLFSCLWASPVLNGSSCNRPFPKKSYCFLYRVFRCSERRYWLWNSDVFHHISFIISDLIFSHEKSLLLTFGLYYGQFPTQNRTDFCRICTAGHLARKPVRAVYYRQRSRIASRRWYQYHCQHRKCDTAERIHPCRCCGHYRNCSIYRSKHNGCGRQCCDRGTSFPNA